MKYHNVVTIYDQIISDGGEPILIKKSEYSLFKTDLTRYKEKTHDVKRILILTMNYPSLV